MSLIELRDVSKTYFIGEIHVPVLKGITLDIEQGEYVALMGASGSGKSTLMNILGCLDRPTTGEYRLDGMEVGSISGDERALGWCLCTDHGQECTCHPAQPQDRFRLPKLQSPSPDDFP